jgi:hypothetical protein
MFLRSSMLGTATIALLGLPYLMSTPGKDGQTSKDEAKGGGPIQVPAGDAVDLRSSAAPPFLANAAQANMPLTGPPVSGLEEILRFDVTPDWVLARWPRVSTTTNQPELKGYRVPVVTGARPEDLAGSLTYFFNARQELQRIVFHGTTGKPEPLVQFLADKFEFRPVQDADAGWQRYQVKWHGAPVSELRVRPAPVVDSTQPQRRYLVNLLIERPQPLEWFSPGERKLSGLRL